VSAAICNSGGKERDFYTVTIGDGESLTITVTSGYFYAHDAQGHQVDWPWPYNSRTLENLPAGTYYFEVAGGDYSPVTISYTITATRSAQ
jgi:hypothetical protein